MATKRKITDINLYELFDITSAATSAEIRQAYRKKALKCHPDKNPDNPKAVQLFLELSDALLILLDPKAKEAYDQTIKAREAAKLRTLEFDSKRRKFKEDLERREKEAKEASLTKKPESNEAALAFEIARLKKEGSRALIEEQENMRQEILRENAKKSAFIQSSIPTGNSALVQAPRLKIKWKPNSPMSYDQINNIACKYGVIAELVVLKKSALVEFSKQEEADDFYNSESDSLSLEWVSKVIPSASAAPTGPSPSASAVNSQNSFAELEAQILKNLMAAARTQKLNEGNETTS